MDHSSSLMVQIIQLKWMLPTMMWNIITSALRFRANERFIANSYQL